MEREKAEAESHKENGNSSSAPSARPSPRPRAPPPQQHTLSIYKRLSQFARKFQMRVVCVCLVFVRVGLRLSNHSTASFICGLRLSKEYFRRSDWNTYSNRIGSFPKRGVFLRERHSCNSDLQKSVFFRREGFFPEKRQSYWNTYSNKIGVRIPLTSASQVASAWCS